MSHLLMYMYSVTVTFCTISIRSNDNGLYHHFASVPQYKNDISSCTAEASDIPFNKVRVVDIESTDSLIDRMREKVIQRYLSSAS